MNQVTYQACISYTGMGKNVHFALAIIFWWVLANSSCITSLKSLALDTAEIKKEIDKISGAPLPKASPTYCFYCDFIMGFDKLKLHIKFEVASLDHFINN